MANTKSYGYYINIGNTEKEQLEHILEFSGFRVDFQFYVKNWEWIKKQLKEIGYVKEYEKKYEGEVEVIYKMDDKKLYFYI